MTEEVFNTYYKKLNKGQKQAVDAIEGPVMVIAGPGTGKTQILTLRIANILRKTDTAPENILALTFTESGVASMRKRLAQIVGSRAYGVVINTFHGFCNETIKNYPEDFPRIVGSKNIIEVDQVEIIERIIDSLDLDLLRPFGDRFLYVRSILSNISELKREGVSSLQFNKIVLREHENFKNIPDLIHEKGAHKGKMKGEYQKLEKQILKNKELALVYEEYQKELTKNKLYDYNDMIMEVLETLEKNKNLLQILQEESQYVLVDEHQDTNNAQNKILEMLLNFHSNPNVFIVGDEKQAIFRFQGASLENFYFFRKLYPKALLITLEENYRSTQSILDSAHSLISSGSSVKHIELKSNINHNGSSSKKGLVEAKIQTLAFKSAEAELYFVAASVKEKIKLKIPPAEIAILYRDNKDAFPIARMLEKFSIPFSIESDQDIFSDPDVKKLLVILEAVHKYGDSGALAEALHVDFLGIDPLDAYKIIRQSNKEKIDLIDFISNDKGLETLGLTSLPNIISFRKSLDRWRTISKNENLFNLFNSVVRGSGLLASLINSPEVFARYEAVQSLSDEINQIIESRPEATIDDFFSFIDTVKKHSIFVKRKKAGGKEDKVKLMTIHRSKGLEFEYVYVTNAYAGHFGSRISRDRLKLIVQVFSDKQEVIEKSKDDDERRLFYVALTRAKKGVYISYSEINSEGREQLPTMFLSEIKEGLVEKIDTGMYEKEYRENKAIMFAEKKQIKNQDKDRQFVREIFLDQGLSVSALNNYLSCPWKYFYRNLVRLPEAKDKHALYGTAVHGALKDFYSKLKGRDLSEDFLLKSFEFYARKEPFTSIDLEEVLEKGKKALSGYYKAHYSTVERNVLTEFKIKGVLLDADIRLTGILDKIEFTGNSNKVNVVDYKTRQPLSRNNIMGETKDSEGNYFRQLIFYKLLLSLYEEGKYEMVSGEIDFIEPDEKGKYKREKFDIDNKEVVTLKDIIKKTAKEILELSFWDKTCDDKECDYCALRSLTNTP
ncbi:MAG: ATP-dependent helicase [Parcubacteria group bacterium]|nr:ATP-dependent helicase [Parcubacteria group bacterium]